MLTGRLLSALLVLLVMLLFIRLGFWQIHRYHEKKAILMQVKTQSQQKPRHWDGQSLPVPYQSVSLQGQYLKEVFLLDNQMYQHQSGYQVLSPLMLANGQVVIVDRGWVFAGNDRRQLPNIHVPQGNIQVIGTAYYPNQHPWVLGAALEKKSQHLMVIEAFDAKLLKQVLQKKVYPFIMHLDKQALDGFVREWPVVSMPPKRHLAYAFQWFALALLAFVCFFVLFRNRNS